MNKSLKIHFMNRLNSYNCGDLYSIPLLYFSQFLSMGICIRHNIDDIRYDYIEPNDFIIIGGGGAIGNAEDKDTEKNINKLFEITSNIIVWGAGFHLSAYGNRRNSDYYKRFKLLGVRDFSFFPKKNKKELPWVPCVTCMCDEFDKKHTIQRKIGVVKHYNKNIEIPDIDKYESITQCAHISQSIDFIASSEIIITNSYHAAYLGTLLGKKVICQPWTKKFFFYKYAPKFYSGDLEDDIKTAVVYDDILEEHRSRNCEYFEEVVNLINFCSTQTNYNKEYKFDKPSFFPLMKGFNKPKDGFIWTNKEIAKIEFPVSTLIERGLKIIIKGEKLSEVQTVKFIINDQVYEDMKNEFIIKADELKGKKYFNIKINISKILIPKELGINNDNRKLGYALYSIGIYEL
jgi:hypothetical protein